MPKKDIGWRLPAIVDPPTRKAVCICIPDELNHIMAFWGALRQLGYWFNWERDTEHKGLDVSLVWAKIVNEAHDGWIEGRMCGTCGDFANCIATDETTRNALLSWLRENQENPPNMSEFDKERPLGGEGWNPSCDWDILWSQCVAIVERTNTAVIDLLEALADGDTLAKVFGVLASLPVLENVGLSSVTDFASLLLTVSLASYSDDYTTTYAETLECEIFCKVRDDCNLTFNSVWEIIRPRVEDEIEGFQPPEQILNLTQWALNIGNFTVELSMLNKADLMLYFIFGGMAYGGTVIIPDDVGMKIFDVAVALASDEPSNDWETLCTDCPPVPSTLTYNSNPKSPELTFITDGGAFGVGARWVASPFEILVTLPESRRVVALKVTAAFGGGTDQTVTIEGIDYPLVRGYNYPGSSTYDWDATIPEIITDEILISLGESRATSFIRVYVVD